MVSILDTVDVYQEVLETIWKDKYKEQLPEELTLLLGELKFKIGLVPLSNTPINEELLKLDIDS
jgi:hypothetical protein